MFHLFLEKYIIYFIDTKKCNIILGKVNKNMKKIIIALGSIASVLLMVSTATAVPTTNIAPEINKNVEIPGRRVLALWDILVTLCLALPGAICILIMGIIIVSFDEDYSTDINDVISFLKYWLQNCSKNLKENINILIYGN